jgi:ABC-type polysaccharide/polyol phosphate export permease
VISGVLRSTAELSRSLWDRRRLVLDFVSRDLRSRYAGSSLGFFWSVVQPLANLAVYMFVFNVVIRARWSDSMTSAEVSLVMLTGFLAWATHAETLARSTTCVQDNSNLIQKVVFPAEVLPTYLSLSAMVSLLVGLPIILAAMLLYSKGLPNYEAAREAAFELAVKRAIERGVDPGSVALGPELAVGLPLLLVPLLIVLQWIFSTGVAYLMSTLQVLLRDLQHLVPLLITVWMFSTPIFYSATLLADKSLGPIPAGLVLEFNPMYWLIDSYQRTMLYGMWPQWNLLLRFAAVALVVFALGSRFLMREKRGFPDQL